MYSAHQSNQKCMVEQMYPCCMDAVGTARGAAYRESIPALLEERSRANLAEG